jgi:hypothetical protein
MVNRQSIVDEMALKFPGLREQIEKLVIARYPFREACENYLECEQIIHRELHAEVPNMGRIREYQSLLQSFETEIRGFFHEPI